ncbi:hypothetical protein RGQ30_16830 [Limnobacter thiooxidans]|uniref:Uncharacterized protein n=2 Tax=Burkholderiaceae TaxID=119060 RepID=A0AA86JKH7_9BURK|nr:hypothetical protein RGQ30_16830 [Limnobacter thiooxidans]
MRISLNAQTHHASFTKESFQAIKHFTRRVDTYLDRNEAGFERMARVRKTMQASPGNCHYIDRKLTTPEQYKSPLMRGLVHVCDCMEEIAESCADISGLAERLVRYMISSGDKNDLALVLASAVGRIVAGQMNLVGMAVHKVAGASLYALSSLLSLATWGLAKTRLGALRSQAEMAELKAEKSRPIRLYEPVANTLLKGKETVLGHLLRKLEQRSGSVMVSAIRQWARHLHRGHSLVCSNDPQRRKGHCSYMWKNLHQYGPVTRALMHFAYFTFQFINKVLVSYDKHLGTAIGERLLAKKTGSILGCRLGLTAGVGLAAGLSIPLSPLLVGISTVAAAVCGVALVALLLAKSNVHLFQDWKGNITAIQGDQVFGKVTPTWP